MILSMTGFGKASNTVGSKTISVTIKTLNSKQQDISVKMPSLYKDLELDVRNILSDNLTRGKIDCNIFVENNVQSTSELQQVDTVAIDYYFGIIKELTDKYPEKYVDAPKWTDILRMPGVSTVKTSDNMQVEKEEVECLFKTISDALVEVKNFRKQEGDVLESVLFNNIKEISRLLSLVDKPENERIESLRNKIEEYLLKVDVNYDKNRFEQEMIYYIEKLDINEEKTRLKNHLEYFVETIKDENAGQGKTLGFIAQEIGREINTMGSKSANAQMQQIVVKMKDNLEQIKEQILNVL